VGLSSLIHGTPVKVLGSAIYNHPGLTMQGSLKDFWTDPETIDAERVRIFTRNLIETCQANGSFYTRSHRTALVTQAAQQMAKQYVLYSGATATAKQPKMRPRTSTPLTVNPPQEPGRKLPGQPNETVH
jgi:hypothetical protein